MRLITSTAAAALLLCPFAGAQAPPDLVLTHARVYASPLDEPLDDAVVVMSGGRISAVGREDAVRVPPGSPSLHLRGAVVVAGYQNSHVHFTEERWVDSAGQPPAQLTAALTSMLTRYGFTTVVDTGSLLPNTVALRRRIESGEVDGPRIYTAGTPLYPAKGIPYYLRETLPAGILPLLPQPSSAEEAADMVSASLGAGADIVKLFTGSWVERGQVLPMDVAVATRAVADAHRRGALAFAHASSAAGTEVALAAGVDVVAHALDAVEGITPGLLRRMKARNVALIPTLTLFADDRNARDIAAPVSDYQQLNGDVLFGTDVGYHTVYDPTREYELMERVGLTWRQILASLTSTPARRFGEGGERGAVAAGMAADLVVLNRDPAGDVRAFGDVRATIRAGRVIYQGPVTVAIPSK